MESSWGSINSGWYGNGALLTFLYIPGFAPRRRVWLAPSGFNTEMGLILEHPTRPIPVLPGGSADLNTAELLPGFLKDSWADPESFTRAAIKYRDYSPYFPAFVTILNPC